MNFFFDTSTAGLRRSEPYNTETEASTKSSKELQEVGKGEEIVKLHEGYNPAAR